MNLENKKTEKKICIYNTTAFLSFKLSDLKEINVFSNTVRFNINGALYSFNRVSNTIFINDNEIEINDDFLKNAYNILSKYEQ